MSDKSFAKGGVSVCNPYLSSLLASCSSSHKSAEARFYSTFHHPPPPGPFRNFSSTISFVDNLLTSMESLFNSPPNPNDASDQPHHILEPLAFKYNYQSQYMCNMVHAMDDITYSKLAESCLVPFAVFGYGLREFTETFYVADRLILALGGEAQKEDECAGRCHGPYDGHHGGVWEGGNEHSEGCDCTSEEEEDEESYDEIAHEEGVWGGDEMDLSD